ncbi:uncharacterized protein LOC143212780 [Lasioglossum baleicum]|uniref:uncharacterized protein LOC143212780 n=1 Tax=Lasioglossum baleicum TaxID=434251 RepID=UPI003FCE7951
MHFVITFGFLVSTKSYENAGSEKSTASKKKVTKKRRLEEEVNITEVASNIINTGGILTETHVEYELLPGYTFKFDCRCWKTATKIYTENGDWCLRPILCPVQENNYVWVIFSVHHEVHLNETQLRILFNHVITYQIFPGRKKFSERAKKDKVKQLYTDPEAINIQSNDFLELYPSEWKDNIRSKPEPTVVKHETDEFSITSYLDVIPDSRHQHKFWKMIRKDRFPSERLEIELAPAEVPLKTKKLKHTKKQEAIVQKLSLAAGNLFSNMGTITCWTRMWQISSISSTFIYTQCDNILSNNKLRRALNNISIKLEQMSNFPDDIVIQNGFSYLYVKADFIGRTIVTPYYAIAKTIYFEFMQSFVSEEFQAEELISFLGTKLLTFQVIGVRSRNTGKSLISIPKTQSKEPSMLEKEAVLLGFASFDLSDLLRGLWEVKLTGSLRQPTNTNDCSGEDSLNSSPFTYDILTMFGTVLKIKVRSAHDLRMIHQMVLEHIRSFNRIFLILEDYPLADNILADVFSHNCTLFSNIEASEDNNVKVEETSKDILTGFAIDSCNRYYIFLEGLAKGYLLKVWERVAKLESKSVFYDSSAVFLVRLYKDFICIGGVLKLKLSEPLEVQLRQHSMYIGKTRTTHQAHLLRTVRNRAKGPLSQPRQDEGRTSWESEPPNPTIVFNEVQTSATKNEFIQLPEKVIGKTEEDGKRKRIAINKYNRGPSGLSGTSMRP